MTGESLLRLYVYGLALAFLTWMLLMGWLVTRSARRYLRRDRSLATAQTDVGQVAQVGERHHLPI
jgi:threonine/homoserine/homoserine lactone efflux protein